MFEAFGYTIEIMAERTPAVLEKLVEQPVAQTIALGGGFRIINAVAHFVGIALQIVKLAAVEEIDDELVVIFAVSGLIFAGRALYFTPVSGIPVTTSHTVSWMALISSLSLSASNIS